MKADDPSQVIEEAKALAAQSLASVTYQINSLACTVLRLLDSQAMQMKDMESSVNLMSLVRSTFPTFSPHLQHLASALLIFTWKIHRCFQSVSLTVGCLAQVTHVLLLSVFPCPG